MGKTALLNALADSASASGTMALRVAGAEFEGDVTGHSFHLRVMREGRCRAGLPGGQVPCGLAMSLR